MTLRIGSMCSGYGGLDIAVQQVFGGEVAWHAELDPDASKVLAHRYPGVPNLGDITTVRWQDAVRVDIVCAGFPCTDLSYAGRGDGIQEGNRSGLWYPIADALGVLRPRLIVLENVAAIVGRRPGLDVVLADLARLGFDAEWTCVRASDVGAAHRRDRWFLAAHPADLGHQWRRGARGRWPGPADCDLAAADAERHGLQGQRSDAGPRPGRPAEAAIGRRSAGGGLAPSDTAGDGRGEVGSWSDGDRRGLAANHDHEPAADTDRDGLARGQERDGHPEARVEAQQWDDADGRVLDWGAYGPAIRRWEAILGRPAPRPTEPGANGQPRLTPAFSEWLMGLPAGHVTDVPGISRNAQLRLLGNGVVPPQAAAALFDLAVSA